MIQPPDASRNGAVCGLFRLCFRGLGDTRLTLLETALSAAVLEGQWDALTIRLTLLETALSAAFVGVRLGLALAA